MFLKDISFRVKLFVVIFIAIFMPSILVSVIMYKRSETAIVDQTSKVVVSSVNVSINNIDSALNSVVGMSDLMLTDSNFLSYVDSRTTFSPDEKVGKYSAIHDQLTFFISRIKTLNILDEMNSYYLYLRGQNTLIDSSSTYYENVDINRVDFLQKSRDNTFKDSWYVSVPVNYYTLNGIGKQYSSDNLITLNKTVKDKYGADCGVLAINIDKSFLQNYYDKIQSEIPGKFMVIGKNNNVIECSDSNEAGNQTEKYAGLNEKIGSMKNKSGKFFFSMGNKTQLIIYSISGYTNWKYVVIIDPSNILGQVYEIRKFLVFTILITALLIFGITFLLANTFCRPLDKLVKAMQEIEKRNLNVRIDDKRRDEYQKVYRGFNDMAAELKKLISDLTTEKMVSKEAKIKLLQEQINPHFLYNTLDSIYSIARLHKVDDISQMVFALSRFFRFSLSGGKDMVSLREAISLVKSYLTVQNIRFKGKFTFQVDVPEDLMNCRVPKMILQPVVENSIYHGIERKKDVGHLYVCAKEKAGELMLRVQDDGVGIAPDELAKLKMSLRGEAPEDERNFALKNLNTLIKLRYGPDFGISITSVRNKGTVVVIRIPAVRMAGGTGCEIHTN